MSGERRRSSAVGGAASLPRHSLMRERDADDAGEHDRGAREPGQEPTLAEPEASDERREENRELARRDDVTDLRETEGEQDEQVAREIHRRRDDDRPPVVAPLAGEGLPVAYHDRRREEGAHAEPHEGDVRQRVEAADAGLVDDRVARDEEAREERPGRPGAARLPAAATPPADREVEGDDASDDQGHAHGSEPRE